MKRTHALFLDFALLLGSLLASLMICKLLNQANTFDRIQEWSLQHQVEKENNYHATFTGNFAYLDLEVTIENRICQKINLTEEMLSEEYLVVYVRMGSIWGDGIAKGKCSVRLTQNNIRWQRSRESETIKGDEWYALVVPTELLCEGEASLDLWCEEECALGGIKIFVCMDLEENRMKTDINDQRLVSRDEVYGDFLINDEVQEGVLTMMLYTTNDENQFHPEDTQVRLLHDQEP